MHLNRLTPCTRHFSWWPVTASPWISRTIIATHNVIPFISPSHCNSYSLISQNKSPISSRRLEIAPSSGLLRDQCFQCHPFSKTQPPVHEYRINIHSLKERGSVKTDECTQGIVTRCRGGNTWSIPCSRNVFISLFTNVAISRCVHYKVHCRLDHSIKQSVASMGNLCWGRGLCYLNSWHSLVRQVQMCTGLRLLYLTEVKNTDLSPCLLSFQQDRLYFIQCHHTQSVAQTVELICWH